MASLSIILPCYNPQLHPDWVAVIMKNMQQIREKIPDCELILVNDGTPADIEEGLKRLTADLQPMRLVSYPQNRGKGYAIRQGVALASAELIIYTDIDFPYEQESLLQLYHLLKAPENDIVIGVKDEAYYRHVPDWRRNISKLLRWLIRNFLSIRITDTQCGLKGIKANARHLLLEGQIDRYLFDLELIYNAEKAGYRILALPVRLREGIAFSSIRTSLLIGELRNFLSIVWASRKAKIKRKTGS